MAYLCLIAVFLLLVIFWNCETIFKQEKGREIIRTKTLY